MIITYLAKYAKYGNKQISKQTIRNKFACIKDTLREKVPSSKTLTPTKSKSMGLWVIGTSNQLFVRGS